MLDHGNIAASDNGCDVDFFVFLLKHSMGNYIEII